MYNYKLNETFILRMKAQGRNPFKNPDGEDPEEEIQPQKKGRTDFQNQQTRKLGEPWTHEKAEKQSYQALLNEGISLYKRNEYLRAIDALTKAYNKGIDGVDNNILIDRADCYIQVGKPELAIEDVNHVLKEDKNNPRAILTKAEAYFSMGEFEFALVFFQRGLAIRKDMVGFKDGVTKAKHAILDSINNEKVFQPNPNYSASRTRKPLLDKSQTQTRSLPKDDDDAAQTDDPSQKKKDPAALLPEKVVPLATTEEKENYLGELSLDYQFLTELQAELKLPQVNTTEQRKKENDEISEIVADALEYLDTRGSFWSQQGAKSPPKDEEDDITQTPKTTRSRSTKERTPQTSTKKPRPQTSRGPAHYEMSKLQQYESRYPSK